MDSLNTSSEVSISSVQIKEEPLDSEPEPEDFINPAENVKVELEEEDGVKLETNATIDPLANVQAHYTVEASSSEPGCSRKRPAPTTSEMAPCMIKVQSSFSLRDGSELNVHGSSSLDCQNPSLLTRSEVSLPDKSHLPIPKTGEILQPEINPSRSSNEFRNSLPSLSLTGRNMEDLVTRNTDIVFGVKCFSCPFCKHFSRNKSSMKNHIYYKHRNSKKSTITSSTPYSPITNHLPRTAMALNKSFSAGADPSFSTSNSSLSPSIITSSLINPSTSSKTLLERPPSSINHPKSLSNSTSSSPVTTSSTQSIKPSLSIHTPSSLSISTSSTSINPSTPPIKASLIHTPSSSSSLSINMSSSSSSSTSLSTNPSSSSQSSPEFSNIPALSLTNYSQSNCIDTQKSDNSPSVVIKKELESDTKSLTEDVNPMFQDNNVAYGESIVKLEPSYDDALSDDDRLAAYDNPPGEFDGSGLISASVIKEGDEPVVDPSVPSNNRPDWLLDCEMMFSNVIDDEALEKSVVRVYGIKCFKCPRCDHLSRNLRQMRSHFVSKHTIRRSEDPRVKGVIYKCRNCPFNSTKMSEFKFHLMSAHGYDESRANRLERVFSSQTTTDRPHGQNFNCTLCSFESETAFGIETHMMTVHADLRPFQCKQCRFNTLNKNDFLRHLMEHDYTSSSKRKSIPNILSTFKCKYCDYRSVRKRDLLNHVYTSHPPVATSS